MTDRDDDLDAMAKELEAMKGFGPGPQPFIERPPHIDIHKGTLCWMDGSRVCGSDCVAFNPEELDDDGDATDSPNKCLPLVYMGQQGAAALSILAVNRRAAQLAADDRRAAAAAMPVPPVGGKK